MSVGKSVQLFLVDGTPGGLLTAEIIGWTGHFVAAPRSDLAALLRRPEASRTGIYVLLGDDPNSIGGQLAYVGQSDDVGSRLRQHARPEERNGKDFWDRAIIFTSKDAHLTNAHARYLESEFIRQATQANRAKLINSTAPVSVPLPEADESDMEDFVSKAKIVFPLLGVNLFRSAATATAPVEQANKPGGTQPSPTFELQLAREGLRATAQEIDGEFTVRAGSRARSTWGGSAGGYQQLREKLEVDGTLAPTDDGKGVSFTHDQVFASPSAAAAVVLGRSANGRNEWKDVRTRVTYGDWQAQLIEVATPEGLS